MTAPAIGRPPRRRRRSDGTPAGVDVAFGRLLEESITLLRGGVRQTGGSSDRAMVVYEKDDPSSLLVVSSAQDSTGPPWRELGLSTLACANPGSHTAVRAPRTVVEGLGKSVVVLRRMSDRRRWLTWTSQP